MRMTLRCVSICGLFSVIGTPASPQSFAAFPPPPADTLADAVRILASRLELPRYKATIKSLTQFGDRRQGTDRNANAVTWIETQLKSYGCASVERLVYDYQPATPVASAPVDSASRIRTEGA